MLNSQGLAKIPRWQLILLLSAVLATGGMALHTMQQFRPVESTESQPPPIAQVAALGRLEPAGEVVRVSTPVALSNDRLGQLLVKRGDKVEANQVIAQLDSYARLQTALLEARRQVDVADAELVRVQAGAKSGEIAAQQAEIARLEEELQGELLTQQATIARWESEVNVADAEFNRYRSLYQDGAIAASELDEKRLALETAQAQLNEVRAGQTRTADTLREQIRQARATLDQIAEVRPVDVQVAQAEVEQAQAAVTRAEADLAEATVRAPIAGRILEIYAKPGETVGEEGIVDLGQTDQMDVVAEVYQTDIGKIRVGQSATVTSPSFAGPVSGTVHSIGLQVMQQEVSSGNPGENLDRRIVEVRIRLNSEDSPRVANLTNLQVQVAIQL